MTLDDFEAFAELYWKQYFEPDWERFTDVERSKKAALKFFLYFYAFERQGSSPDYRYVSVDVIDELNEDEITAETVWNHFKGKMKEIKIKPNEKNNPLCPKGAKFTWHSKKKKKDIVGSIRNISIIELINGDELKNFDGNIVKWARQELIDGSIKNVYEKLIKINGISTKIATFFLRDIAVKFRIQKITGNPCLQPVDVWVRYFAENVLRIETKDKADDEVAIKICERLKELRGNNAEKINQGVWYFSANIAKSSKYLFKKGFEDKREMKKLIEWYYKDNANSQVVLKNWIEMKSVYY